MRTASPSLVSFLLSKQPFFLADLFTFDFVNGATLAITSYNKAVTYGLKTWSSFGQPVITRGRWDVKNTIDVPTLEVTLLTTGGDYGGGNLKTLLHNGYFDGSTILLERAFMPTSGDTTYGTVTLFGGRCGPVELGSKGAKITYKGFNVLMQQFMPKNRYLLQCIHHLYDAGCTLNRASFTSPDTVGSPSNQSFISWPATPPNAVNYTNGYVTITSGPAIGQTRTIQAASSAGILLSYPLYEVPNPGDGMSVTFGCDRTLNGAQGCAFFANQQHFRGFPFVPPAELGL